MVNGDVFRWSWMWGRLAQRFGVEPAPFPGRSTPLWAEIVRVCTSMMASMESQPSPVGMSVKSASRSWLGAAAVNCRSSRLGATGKAWRL